MPIANFRPTIKQYEAWQYLHDETTNVVGFGGAARGGKSQLGNEWIIFDSLMIPDSVTLLCREELKRLKATTLVTLFRILKTYGLLHRVTYNEQKSTLVFEDTNSVVYLLELANRPSDPEYEYLGSYDATRIFIDEASRVPYKAYTVLQARLSHLIGQEYEFENQYGKMEIRKIIPKTLCSMNPNKGWNYRYFYEPHKKGELPDDRKFIQALPQDNPHNPQEYIDNLAKQDYITVQRLLHGNWEYDDDRAALMEYDKIVDLFKNDYVEGGSMYITADIARLGSDKAVIMVWDGMRVIAMKVRGKILVTECAELIKKLTIEYKVPMSNVIVDEDGVGGGVKDILRCRGFVNNKRPRKRENYANLKSQCWYKFADKVNKGEVFITDIPIVEKYKDEITKDLESIRRKDPDKDGKLTVIGKDKIKEAIGRSPDFGDTLMMRMYFEYISELVII